MGDGRAKLLEMGRTYLLATAPFLIVLGCAKGNPGTGDDDGGNPDGGGGGPDGSCGETCDSDHDGVTDMADECPDTPAGQPVNDVGCSDSQVAPTLNPDFPPYGLTWTPTGDLGRAGGLTWTYTGIDRADLFHIYWIVCDDPSTTCGLSLDGAIDDVAEDWVFSAAQSNLPGGKLVLVNTTHIALADGSNPQLNGRVTINIVDGTQAAVPFTDVADLGVTARSGTHGAEIPGTAFTVTVVAEVQDATSPWTPYLDYYDAAATPDPSPGATVSFGGSFYDE